MMSKYRITLDGKTYEMEVERVDRNTPAAPAAAPVQAAPAAAAPTPAPMASAAPAAATADSVQSPMPGTVLRIAAKEGEQVKKGQLILVLEAMKMENEIVAQKDGKLRALFVSEGDSVQGGAALFEIGE